MALKVLGYNSEGPTNCCELCPLQYCINKNNKKVYAQSRGEASRPSFICLTLSEGGIGAGDLVASEGVDKGGRGEGRGATLGGVDSGMGSGGLCLSDDGS